jgi:hypothetical protein
MHPARIFTESLTPRPELENSQCRDGPKCQTFAGFRAFPAYLWPSGTYQVLAAIGFTLMQGGHLTGLWTDGSAAKGGRPPAVQ